RGLNTMASLPGRAGQDTVLTFVTPDYFRVLRIPILRGRTLTAHDDMHSARVGVVNAFFAKKFFGPADPVGRTIVNGGSPMRIVGLVPDTPLKGSLGGYAPVTPIPVIFVPAAQTPDDLFQLVDAWFTPSFIVRSEAPARDIVTGMQKAIGAV